MNRPRSHMHRRTLRSALRTTRSIDADWPAFWRCINLELKHLGYANSTRRFYRQVLRSFARHARCPPACIDRETILAYLRTLQAPRCSPYWTAMNLSVLRTVFDRVCGRGLLLDRRGPRIPHTLPELLGEAEIFRMIESATSLRDRILLGLLFGCGLKVGELRNLRWRDVHMPEGCITARSRFGPRLLPLPRALVPVLAEGSRRCPPDGFILAGVRPHRPLSARWIQILVRCCAQTAGIEKPVTAMTLRHTYAVQSLEAGSNVRELQVALGHRFVQSTMRYLGCLVPVVDPLSSLGAPPPPVPVSEPTVALAGAGGALRADIFLSTARSACEFLSTLRMQIGPRLFAPRGPDRSTGPP